MIAHQIVVIVRGRLWPIPLCLALASSSAAADRYVRAAVNADGNLSIQTSSGQSVEIKKAVNEVGLEQIAIAPDGSAVGWVGLHENCCTSYPIPTRLFVYFKGTTRMFVGNDLPVFQWHFLNGSKRVAFFQGTTHGDTANYEIHDVASGRLIAKWSPEFGLDNQRLPNQKPPDWVRQLGGR